MPDLGHACAFFIRFTGPGDAPSYDAGVMRWFHVKLQVPPAEGDGGIDLLPDFEYRRCWLEAIGYADRTLKTLEGKDDYSIDRPYTVELNAEDEPCDA